MKARLVAVALLAAMPASAQRFDSLYPICLAAVPVTHEEALDACTNLIDAKRDWPEDRATLHYDRARVHQWRGKLDLALADMDAAVKLKPADSTLAFARAVLLEDMGRTADAMRQLGEAIRVGYAPVNALPCRGFLALKLGRLDEALADFDATLKLAPDNAEALFGRGVVRVRKGDAQGRADIARAKATDDTVGPRYGLAGY